jgi:Rrf2 family protein
MLSGTAEYALRAVVYLAGCGAETPVRAVELARAVDVPANYMGKILHELARAGILKSARGKRGGFQLAAAADQLPLLSVVAQFDKLGEERKCLMGRAKCSDHDPCATHERWGQVAERIDEFFRNTTVADVKAR